MLQGLTSDISQTDTQTSVKCLRTCCGPDCNKVTNSLVSLFCSDHCIEQYVKHCTEMQVCSRFLLYHRILMLWLVCPSFTILRFYIVSF